MKASAPGSGLRTGWRVWVSVAAGGFLGTLLRHTLGQVITERPGELPWTTLGINVLGSFLLGWLTARWASPSAGTPRWLRAALGPGLLGSFTTFSAVSLTGATSPALLLPYVGLSVVAGVGGAATGMVMGRRQSA